MKKFSIKKMILGLIALAMAIVTLSAPAAPLGGAISYSENGFSMLGFTSTIFMSRDEWMAVFVAFMTIAELLIGAAAAVFGILSAFVFPKKAAKSCSMTFVIICLVDLALYLVQGILFCEFANSNYTGAIFSSFTTLSYVPLIFGMLCFVAYFVCAKKIRDKDEQMNAQPVLQPNYAGQADGYAQPAQQAVYYGAQPVQPSAYAAQPAQPSAYAAQPAQSSAYAAQPAQSSAYAAQPVQPSPYAAQPSAFAAQPAQPSPYAAQPVPPSPYAAPSAQQGGEKPAADTDMVTKLTQYKTLLDSGILSQEEFDRLKADLLKRQ